MFRNMITNKIAAIIFILIALISGYIFFTNKNSTAQKIVTINGQQIKVEIADTDAKRTQGLSGRDKLAQNEGMLFIFSAARFYRFWMKEMKFPLDFIWIDTDKIVDLTENVPPPKSAGEVLPTFSGKYPYDKVLEINAGTVKSFGIKIGDKILL